jgi:hypothetical protein
MFCLIYLPNNGESKLPTPHVLEISQSKDTLLKHMENESIQRCIDEVGRKNFINTLDEKKDIATLPYPIYPTVVLKRGTDAITVHRVEKKQVILKGYLYNSVDETVRVLDVGTFFVVPITNWKYEDFPRRPEDEKKKVTRPEPCVDMVRGYDKVLLQLIESIQKRKID